MDPKVSKEELPPDCHLPSEISEEKILGVAMLVGSKGYVCHLRSLAPSTTLHLSDRKFYLRGGRVNKAAYAALARTFLTLRIFLCKGIASANRFPSKCLVFAFNSMSIYLRSSCKWARHADFCLAFPQIGLEFFPAFLLGDPLPGIRPLLYKWFVCRGFVSCCFSVLFDYAWAYAMLCEQKGLRQLMRPSVLLTPGSHVWHNSYEQNWGRFRTLFMWIAVQKPRLELQLEP